MQNLSSWAALGVISVSLLISNKLAIGKFFQANQTSRLTSEASGGLLTAHTLTKLEYLNQQNEELNQKNKNLNKQTRYLNQPIELSSNSLSQPISSATALEQEFYEQINKYRLSRHLPLLVLDPRISEQARTHSQAMANGQVPFSQQGFEQRSEAVSRVIPYQRIGEIVAYTLGYADPVRAAVGNLIRDPKRVVSIEGEYDLTGIGVATNLKGEYYFTQIFIHRQ